MDSYSQRQTLSHRLARFAALLAVFIPFLIVCAHAAGALEMPCVHHPLAWGWIWAGVLTGWLGSVFFTVLDQAVFSLDPDEIEEMGINNPTAAKELGRARKNVDQTWITLLAGGLFFNLILGISIGCAVLRQWEKPGLLSLAASVAAATVFVFVMGEILPGLVAARKVKALAPAAGMICRFCFPLFAPLTFAPLALLRFLSGCLRLDTLDRARAVEVEKRLLALIGYGQVDIRLEVEEREMIDQALEFADSQARDIMTPRNKIEAIETNSPHPEVLKMLRKSEYSRIIVYEKTLDHIVGILHKRLALLSPARDYHEHITPALFVTEDTELLELISIMKKQRRQMVVVLDEFGATEGVVSMNDLLQALVGVPPEAEKPV